MESKRSDEPRKQATPAGDGQLAFGAAIRGHIAVEGDLCKAGNSVRESSLQGNQLCVDVSHAHPRAARLELGVSLLGLPVHFGFASRPHEALNDGQGGDDATDPGHGSRVARKASSDCRAAARQTNETEHAVEPLVQALVQSIENAPVLDVHDGFVGGSFVGPAGSSFGHSLSFGFTGGGLRDGGTCDRPSPFSMGGPFKALLGCGDRIVTKEDRPPLQARGEPRHIRLTYALAEGPAIRIDGIWHSTSEAITWACDQGAIVAAAKVLP